MIRIEQLETPNKPHRRTKAAKTGKGSDSASITQDGPNAAEIRPIAQSGGGAE